MTVLGDTIPADLREKVREAGRRPGAIALAYWAADVAASVLPYWAPAVGGDDPALTIEAIRRVGEGAMKPARGAEIAGRILAVGRTMFLGVKPAAYMACMAAGSALRGVVAVERCQFVDAQTELYSAVLMAAAARSDDIAPHVDGYLETLSSAASERPPIALVSSRS